MLKLGLKKVGLSLLFAGVLSVGLSINSANAFTLSQENFLEVVENVVKATEINGSGGPNNGYGANDFWAKVAKLNKKDAYAVRHLFSDILREEGVLIKRKNYWIEIFGPYKEKLKKNSRLKLSEFITSKTNSEKRRRPWKHEENERMNKFITDYLKSLNGDPLPERGAWVAISEKYNEDIRYSERRDCRQIRKHFSDLYFSEEAKKGNYLYYTTVFDGFSKLIHNNPEWGDIEQYIDKVKSGEIKLPASDREILAKVRKMLYSQQ